MSSLAKVRFSLQDLFWLVTGLAVFFAVLQYFGRTGLIFSSPLLGLGLIYIGSRFGLRMLTILGAILFFAGPLLLGLLAAFLAPA